MQAMNGEDYFEDRIRKTIKAGRILKSIKEEIKGKIKPGISVLEIAEFVEEKIKKYGAKPAFPCNISINSDAAHYTPKKNDTKRVNDGDLIKVDIGAHIDGWIADTAITIDLGDNKDLVQASEEALKRAIEIICDGVNTAEIGGIIENTIKEFGYKPIINLTGHGLERYRTHAPPAIFNIKLPKGTVLKEGMIIAIEPFATNGVGKVIERGEVEIFSFIGEGKAIRIKKAREMLNEIKEFKTLPFAKRWLKKPSDLILQILVKNGILKSYPVLTEKSGGLVSQAEHTIIIEKDGARIIT